MVRRDSDLLADFLKSRFGAEGVAGSATNGSSSFSTAPAVTDAFLNDLPSERIDHVAMYHEPVDHADRFR